MIFRRQLDSIKTRPPILIGYEHLYSEFQTLEPPITDAETLKEIEKLNNKKSDKSLSWNDLYFFELILANVLPLEKLRSKIMRLRFDYRSVAGQKEFDDYMAAKPPDLQSPPAPAAKTATPKDYEEGLREDLKDLLGRMYLEYAVLPVREERLKELTWYAAGLCLFVLVILLGILAIMFIVPVVYGVDLTKDVGIQITELQKKDQLSSLTIFVVVVTGAMGGFVSALQRIQSPTTDGDSLYNLSLLFHSSSTVFVAPITGAIFATLLYLLFVSQLITGSFFPSIYTPEGAFNSTPDSVTHSGTGAANSNTNASPSPSPKPLASNTVGNRPQANAASSPALVETSTPTPTPTVTPSPTPKTPTVSAIRATSETKQSDATQGLNIFAFLARSGPINGTDYALLIVWCFIAGFAERFVPDVLDRLIAKGGSAAKP